MTRRIEAGAGVVALLALVAMLLVPFRGSSPGAAADLLLAKSDFGAFYCGSLVMRTGGDPYKLSPLAACETQRVYEPAHLTLRSQGIDPAPLPAYDLAFFAPLTSLPYRAAGLLWLGLIAAAFCGSALALRTLTGLPFALTLAALAYGDGAICFTYGQEQPLVTLGLTGAAIALAAKRDGRAVACATIAFLEPQIGLPTMLALTLFSRARIAAMSVMAGLGLLSLAFGGWSANVEYLTRVLPVHAFSELGVDIQYSFASLMFAARVPDALALQIAGVQYVLTAGLGIALAAPLAQRIGRPALVLLPAACAVVGGTFIHIQEIASALPFALYLVGRVPVSRPWSAIAVALLALPWPLQSSREALVFDAIVIGALCTWLRPARTTIANAALALVLFAVYLATARAMTALPQTPLRAPDSAAAMTAARYDPALASTELAYEWRASRASDGATLSHLAKRAPTWLALIVLVLLAARLTVRKTQIGDPAVKSAPLTVPRAPAARGAA